MNAYDAMPIITGFDEYSGEFIADEDRRKVANYKQFMVELWRSRQMNRHDQCSCIMCNRVIPSGERKSPDHISVRFNDDHDRLSYNVIADGADCAGAILEAMPGIHSGFVVLIGGRYPHTCSCGSGYTCVSVVTGEVFIIPMTQGLIGPICLN